MKPPIWVLDEAVIAIHRRQITEHGGADGVRSPGLLDSALARPKNLLAYSDDVDLAALAASYAYGIVASIRSTSLSSRVTCSAGQARLPARKARRTGRDGKLRARIEGLRPFVTG